MNDVPHIGVVLGQNIRTQRLLRQWTQEQLADAVAPFLGPTWDQRLVAQVEKGSGRRLLAAELIALASVLDVDVWTLSAPPGDGEYVRVGDGEPMRSVPPSVDRDRMLDAHWALSGARNNVRALAARLQSLKYEVGTAASAAAKANEAAADVERQALEILDELNGVTGHLDRAEGVDPGVPGA